MPRRRVTALDLSARLLTLAAPPLAGRIDQARHDTRAVWDSLRGAPRQPAVTPGTPRERPVELSSIDPLEELLPSGLRYRYRTLRTDARWILNDLRFRGRPHVVERGPRRRGRAASPVSTAIAPRELKVAAIERETRDTLTFRLVGAGLEGARPGQFLTFHLPVSGVVLRRAYSLSLPLEEGAAITVKRIDGGRGSGWLHSQVSVGDTLRFLGPSGLFVLPESMPEELVFIAGGSGITPVHALLTAALRHESQPRVRLLYGSRSQADIIFADRLRALLEAHPGRLSVEHVLEDRDGARLTGDVVAARLDDDAPSSDAHYFVCGPGAMMDAARETLLGRGVTPERLHEERFASPADATPSSDLPSEPVMVQLRVSGRDHLVRVEPGQTVLEAGLAAGAPMPFSCAMGGCAACKGRVLSGELAMEEPNCLTKRERAEGAVLTCCARPLGPASVEVG